MLIYAIIVTAAIVFDSELINEIIGPVSFLAL